MRDTPTFPAPVPWPQRQRAFATPTDAIYLDAASKGARLRHVLDGAHAMLEAEAAPWWLPHADWMRRIEDARALAAQVLFDGDGEGLAMVPSAAHGLATAAANLPLRRGQAVLVLEGQFPSNLLAWQQRCAQAGAHVVGAAGVGLTREVERGQQRLQRAAQFAIDYAGLADVLGGEHIHRRGGLEHRAVAGAGAGDDHRVQVGGGGRGGVLGEGGGRQGQGDGQAQRPDERGRHGGSLLKR